jgi:hypothetical protein
MQLSRTAHMIDLYGKILSPAGRVKSRSWIATCDEESTERFREVFTAVQATFQAKSTMKEAYSPTISGTQPTRQLPCLPYIAVREATDSKSLRTIKPKNQFDGFDVSKALGLEEGEASLEMLKASKVGVTNGAYSIDENGCSVFKACSGNTTEGKSLSFRVVPSFGRGGDWISTSRETLKNFGVSKPERILADQHPAIARVTASSGLCVPNMKGTLHFSTTI